MWSIFMIILIAISIAVLSLETVLSLRQGDPAFWDTLPNITEHRLIYILENSEPHISLLWVELITLVVLTAEFIVRFITCPEKKLFFKSILNIADVIGIMPIWVMISLYFAETKLEGREKGAIVFAYYFMMCLRLLRIFRLFKLVKHYKTLKILLLAIKASYRELLLLVILLTMGVIIYANLIYFVEVEYDNFMSIPEGFWWAIVTMTTVGYGDYYPKSGLGYLVGSLCAITGILVIALPVPVIANNFSTYYGMSLAWERISDTKLARSRTNTISDDQESRDEGNNEATQVWCGKILYEVLASSLQGRIFVTIRNTTYRYIERHHYELTHWGRDKMAAISQTTLSNDFFRMKMFEFRLRFHWNLFPRPQLTIFHHWCR